MKNKKLLFGVLFIFGVSTLMGCLKDTNSINQTNFNNISLINENNADLLISNSDIQGHVVSYSNTSCTISPIETTYDGKTATIPQVGYESKEKNVTVHYNDNCQFQFATINVARKTAEFSNATISNIKEQSGVIIYGDWIDAFNIEATKVILYTFE